MPGTFVVAVHAGPVLVPLLVGVVVVWLLALGHRRALTWGRALTVLVATSYAVMTSSSPASVTGPSGPFALVFSVRRPRTVAVVAPATALSWTTRAVSPFCGCAASLTAFARLATAVSKAVERSLVV